jgi:hypothetical protein
MALTLGTINGARGSPTPAAGRATAGFIDDDGRRYG